MSTSPMINRVVLLLILGVVGYAYLNPSFITTCKTSCGKSLSWVQQQTGAAQTAFKKSSYYASFSKALNLREKRAQERKKAAIQPKIAPAPAQPALDMSPAAVRMREQANWSVGQKIAYGPTYAAHHKEFDFSSPDQMASHIDRVIGYASTSHTKQLSGGRIAYWDDRTHALILVEPNSAAGGTFFKPVQGYPYFKDLK